MIAHGPDHEQMAMRLAEAIRRFDREVRYGRELVVRAYRRESEETAGLGGAIIEKPEVRLVITCELGID